MPADGEHLERKAMFTFLTLSYDQERYIIQHLESIRYQIIAHGADEKAVFVLADDASSDRTVEWARLWLRENEGLFADITILENRENKGVVDNYLKGINTVVPRSRIKCLAADDLYYTRNVFEVLDDHDVVLTPTICFNDVHDVIKNRYYVYRSCVDLEGERLKEKIRRGLDYQNKIQAPGAFVDLGVLQDQGLQRFISQYTWIEDYPQWSYIFNRYDREIDVKIDLHPYVLYRMSSGISLNKEHSKRDVFQAEEEKITKMVRDNSKKNGMAGSIWYLFDMCRTEYLDGYLKPSLRRFKKDMMREAGRVKQYLERIAKREEAFRSKYM